MATYSLRLLEVHLLLDCMDILRIIHLSMCYITYSSMVEQTYIQSIDSILSLPENELLTKRNLIQLQNIKNELTGGREKECFCSMVRRKVWLKDFIQWYEGVS